jgi:hypothetical protein
MPRDDLHAGSVAQCTCDRPMPTDEVVGFDACNRPVAHPSCAKPRPPYPPLADGRSA